LPDVTSPTVHTIRIKSFDPVVIELPKVQTFIGETRIILPPLHLQLYDLSLDGALPGAHIGSDAELAGVTITLSKPGIDAAEMLTFIMAAQDQFKAMWKIVQRELDKHGALL
jgi:hypothetical protein